MKKYLSVFTLFVRQSFYKIFPVFILLGLSQILLFVNTLNTLFNWDGTPVGIEPIIDESKIVIFFGLAFVIITAVLSSVGCEYGSRQGYSLRRLSVTEKEVFCCQTAFNALTYAALIMVQLVIAMILFQIYLSAVADTDLANPGFVSNQTVFLAFYRNDFLHSIMPLDDILRHIRNIIYVVGIGAASAAFPYFQRRRKIGFEMIMLSIYILLTFVISWKDLSVELINCGMAIAITAVCIYRTLKSGGAYEN